MSARWRNAGLVLAALVIVATFTSGWSPWLPADVPVVLRAAFNAVTVFVGIWLYEGIYHVALWLARLLRRLISPSPQRGR